jgi:hypothetical protein
VRVSAQKPQKLLKPGASVLQVDDHLDQQLDADQNNQTGKWFHGGFVCSVNSVSRLPLALKVWRFHIRRARPQAQIDAPLAGPDQQVPFALFGRYVRERILCACSLVQNTSLTKLPMLFLHCSLVPLRR